MLYNNQTTHIFSSFPLTFFFFSCSHILFLPRSFTMSASPSPTKSWKHHPPNSDNAKGDVDHAAQLSNSIYEPLVHHVNQLMEECKLVSWNPAAQRLEAFAYPAVYHEDGSGRLVPVHPRDLKDYFALCNVPKIFCVCTANPARLINMPVPMNLVHPSQGALQNQWAFGCSSPWNGITCKMWLVLTDNTECFLQEPEWLAVYPYRSTHGNTKAKYNRKLPPPGTYISAPLNALEPPSAANAATFPHQSASSVLHAPASQIASRFQSDAPTLGFDNEQQTSDLALAIALSLDSPLESFGVDPIFDSAGSCSEV
ncbi:hypothetical protein C8J56DRAFT_938073 [Mycena floridula]|nr:hypothetical protein C8J56DRAFT_938073 [Mycena floridula]